MKFLRLLLVAMVLGIATISVVGCAPKDTPADTPAAAPVEGEKAP